MMFICWIRCWYKQPCLIFDIYVTTKDLNMMMMIQLPAYSEISLCSWKWNNPCYCNCIEYHMVKQGIKWWVFMKIFLFPAHADGPIKASSRVKLSSVNMSHDGAIETLIHCWWESKTVQPGSHKIYHPCTIWSTNVLLGIYSNELKSYVHIRAFTQVFTAAFFVITKT